MPCLVLRSILLVTSQKDSKRTSAPNALVRIVCLPSASLTTIDRICTQPLTRVVIIGFGGSFLISRNAVIISGELCYSVLILNLLEILLQSIREVRYQICQLVT